MPIQEFQSLANVSGLVQNNVDLDSHVIAPQYFKIFDQYRNYICGIHPAFYCIAPLFFAIFYSIK
jgi:hypothetical protein